MKNPLPELPRCLLFALLLGSLQLPVLGETYTNALPGQQKSKPAQHENSRRSVRDILFDLEEAHHVSFNYDDTIIRGFLLKEDFYWNKNEKLEQVLKRLTEQADLKFEKIDDDNYLIFSEKK